LKLQKKGKKAYELNKHFQDNYVVKLPCDESMLGFYGRVVQMRCKIYTQMKDINKLLVPKLDSLLKHVGHHKVLVAMLGVKKGDHYFLKK
jgi:hypothetical protein